MNHVGLFAKYWEPGTVKTRLASSIGNANACEIYRRFLFHLMERHQDSGSSRAVVFSPIERESDFRKSVPQDWNLSPQAEGNLGDRMSGFFESQFGDRQQARDTSKVVVIGADCPLLDATIVQDAFKLLDEAPVVIGPSEGGGYYLIGMRDRTSDVFTDVDWSTPSVLAQTIEHLERQKIEYRLLKPMNDIDDIDDLRKLAKLMKSRPDADGIERELLQKVQEALTQFNATQTLALDDSADGKPDSNISESE